MQSRTVAARLFLATSSCALATTAVASETVTYTYDALGRLVATTSSGTVNNGLATSIAYDPAGNRSSYSVSGVGGGAPPPPAPPSPPPPPPPPPPGNHAPVANDDRFRTTQCAAAVFDALENDTDADGDALIITSVGGPAAQVGAMSIQNNRLVWNPTVSSGNFTGTYTISDGHGGTATGAFTVQILSGSC
jgi:hypothetical protein